METIQKGLTFDYITLVIVQLDQQMLSRFIFTPYQITWNLSMPIIITVVREGYLKLYAITTEY